MNITNRTVKMKPREFYYYLGHTQAPTSSVRKFSPATSHPFTCGTWVVAHNGVLTNDVRLKKTLKSGTPYSDVDSSVIPALFSQESDKNVSEVEAICKSLS